MIPATHAQALMLARPGMAGLRCAPGRGLRGLGGPSGVQTFLRTAATGAVRSVVLRSNLSPDVELTNPLEVAGPSGGGVRRRGGFSEALLALMKPEVEVETAVGTVRIAPWGQPTMNLFWPIVILGAASAVSLAIVVGKGLRS